MNCLFIYNPVSGKGKIKKKEPAIVKALSTKFDSVDVLQTHYKGHIKDYLSSAPTSYDYVVVAGGDGTLNELINAIIPNKINAIIGYIPTGTANDFAHSHGIPKNINKALNIILNGKVEACDAIKVNNIYGTYVCGCGIFTGASYTAKQKDKNHVGGFAYFISGIKEFFSAKPFTVKVTVNNKSATIRAALMLIINSKSVAGFKFNKNANLSDGKADVVIIKNNNAKKISFWTKLKIFNMFLFGLKNKKKEHLICFKTSALRAEFNPAMEINIDGEAALKQDFSFEVLNNAIKVMVK